MAKEAIQHGWTEPPGKAYPGYLNVQHTKGAETVTITVRGQSKVFGKHGETGELTMPAKDFKEFVIKVMRDIRG